MTCQGASPDRLLSSGQINLDNHAAGQNLAVQLIAIDADYVTDVLESSTIRGIKAGIADSDLLSHNRLIGCGMSALNYCHAVGGDYIARGSVLSGNKHGGLA